MKLRKDKLYNWLLLFAVFSIPIFFMGLTAFKGMSFEDKMSGFLSVPGSNQYVIKEILFWMVSALVLILSIGRRIDKNLLYIILPLIIFILMFYKNVNPHYAGRGMFLPLLFISIIILVNLTNNIKKSIAAVTIVGFICAIYGLLQYYGFEFVSDKSVPLTSSIGNKNLFAEFLVGVFPYYIYFIFLKRKSAKIWGVAGALILVGLFYLCRTRSAYLGALAILILLPVVIKPDFKRVIIALGAGIVLFSIFYQTFPNFKNIFQTSQGTNRVRILIWKGTLDGIRENFFGTGPGSFSLEYPMYALNAERKQSSHLRVDNAHNEYLQFLLEMGIPIFILVLSGIIISSVISVRKNYNLEKKIALLSALGIGTTAFFGFPFHQYPGLLMISFSMGIILKDFGLQDKEEYLSKKNMVLLFLGILVSIIIILKPIVCNIIEYRGLFYETSGDLNQAVREFSQTAMLMDNNEVYHYRTANAMKKLNLKKYRKEIISNYKNNIELFPTNARNHGNLAEAYRELGNQESAAVGFNRISTLDKVWDYANINLVGIYNKLELYTKSVNLLNNAFLNGYRTEKYYENSGFTEFQLKEYKESEDMYRLLMLYNDSAENYKNYGVALIYNNKKRKAEKVFKEGLKKYPDNQILKNYLTQLKLILK